MQLKLESPWEEVKEKMKENNILLTDDDLLYEPGKEDALLERLAKKMDRSKDEVRVLIESISFNTGLAG